MGKKISKIIWVGMPGSLCNLNCEYCYNFNKKRVKETCLYSVEHMLKSFDPQRFDGSIFFRGTSGGETLLWDGIVDFTEGLLTFGHIVSYVTNMTVTPVVKQFCDFPEELRLRLELDASLHYLELEKKKLVDTFFDNLRMLRSAGISYTILLCISDIYIPYLHKISELCQKEIELLPIACMDRKYDSGGGKNVFEFSPDIQKLIEETCDTRYLELQKRMYSRERTEFCHAGEFSISMSLVTGNYTKCWGRSNYITSYERFLEKSPALVNNIAGKIFAKPNQIIGNIFENPSSTIIFEPIGKCPFYDCVCASQLCWGLIPELDVETHSKTFFTNSSISKDVLTFCGYKIGKSK